MSDLDLIAVKAADLVDGLPRNVARGLVARLRDLSLDASVDRMAAALKAGTPQELHGVVEALSRACSASTVVPSPVLLAMALDSASLAQQRCREDQTLEVLWSGPRGEGSDLRRTEQALLEAISGAKHEIWLLSFVAYRVDSLRAALVDALRRGVQVNLLLETVESSDGGIEHDGIKALRAAEWAGARVYGWPVEKRPLASNKKPAALHVKACLIDGSVLFTSSANMTGKAFELNMELGVLIRGGPQPRQVGRQLRWMVETDVIRLEDGTP